MKQKQIKFPKRRPDGSFCVEITFRVKSSELNSIVARMASWLDQWVQTNRYWKIGFRHPESRDGMFDFLRDFTGPPSCFTPGRDFISLRFDGRSESKRAWKDWLGFRLVKELREAFPEITAIEKVRNCADLPPET